MASDAIQRHKNIAREVDATRKKLMKLERSLTASNILLARGVQPESLWEHIGLSLPEHDITDYLGSDLDEARPGLGPNPSSELLPSYSPPTVAEISSLSMGHPADGILFEQAGGLSMGHHAPTFSSEIDGPYPFKPASTQEISSYLFDSGSDSEAIATGLEGEAASTLAYQEIATRLPHEKYSRAILALTAMSVGIWDWDTFNNKVHMSPYWEALFGPSGHDGNKAFDTLVRHIHQVDAKALMAQVEDMVEGKTGFFRIQVRTPRTDGIYSWADLHAICVRDNSGNLQRIVVTAFDITEECEAALTLHANQEKYRVMAEDSPDLTGRFDSTNCVLNFNSNISHYLPLSQKDVVGRDFASLFPGGDCDFFIENLQQVFTIGIPIQAEAMLVSPLVGEFAADCRFWPERAIDGTITTVTVQMRDLTTSHRMAENYYALFNTMVDGFALFRYSTISGTNPEKETSGDFVVMAMNPSLGKMLEREPEMVTGQGIRELLGQDAEQWVKCLQQVLHNKAPSVHCVRSREYPLIFELSAFSPGPGRVACIVKNVTTMRAIEQSVHLNEARLAALHQLSLMFAAPMEEVIQFSLEKMVKLTGSDFGALHILSSVGTGGKAYWSQDLVARVGNDAHIAIVADKKDVLSFSSASITLPTIVNLPEATEVIGNDISVPIQRYMVAPVIEDGRTVCLVSVANKENEYERSDLRQLELFINGLWFQLRRRWAIETLERAKNEAEAANRSKNEFLANVSHELRTPLNGILGMLQLLHQSELGAEQHEWVDVAEYSSRSLLRLISDILDFSRIEAGKFAVTSRVFDFAATVRSTLGIFVHQATQKNIHFSLYVDKAIPEIIEGDDVLVRQVILNIVGNAFKFTEAGSVAVECVLLPAHRVDTVFVRVTVHDTGIGINEDKVDLVFKPFTQLDGSSTRRYSGVGLGLSIVQRLVQVIGGSVCIESEEGRGTMVHLSLPFKRSSKIALCVADVGQDGDCPPLRVLVAEDDLINQLTVSKLLQKKGHSVMCVENGREAVAALRLQHFDCLITDIQMPVMDGEEATRRIRTGRVSDIIPVGVLRARLGTADNEEALLAVPTDLPIIALSANATAGASEHFLAAGVDYYLTKPVNAADLYALVNKISTIANNRSQKEAKPLQAANKP